jgi:5-methylthioadenosine/S-adenosylhomocysteine deaminase
MSSILLKSVTALLADGSIEETDIVIEDDKIKSIGLANMSVSYDRVIEGKNKLAVAGFVNAHTHASMTLLRSYADDMALMDWLQKKIWPIEAKMKKDDIYWGAMLAIAEMIKSGTTAFVDMYGDMEQVAKACVETKMRAVLTRGIIGVAPNGMAALKENAELYRDFHGTENGRITVMFAPHAPYTCPPDFLRKVVEVARPLNAEIHIHLSETKGEVEDCLKQYGKTPFGIMEETGILECGTLAAHSVHLKEEDFALIKKYNVRIAHNPASNMKLASGVAPVPRLLAEGACVGIGTDGASSNNNLDMIEEMQLAALLHKVDTYNPLAISAGEAVKMATEYGAKAIGFKEGGAIDVGKKADITIFDMGGIKWQPRHNIVSLLAYSADSSSVDTVIVDGNILLDGGLLTTIDEEQVIFEANKRAMKLANL